MNKILKASSSINKPLQSVIRAIGNSKGVVIPKIILEQSGIEGVVDMTVIEGKIILSKPKRMIRERWAQDAQSLANAGEDKLILGDFANEEDGDWVW